MKKIFLFCSIAAMGMAIVGCASSEACGRQEIFRHRQYLEDQARTISVDTSDGISEKEAYKIGKDRFATYRNACGTVATPVDLGDYWRVTTFQSIIPTPCEDILIRKSDGTVTITKAKPMGR